MASIEFKYMKRKQPSCEQLLTFTFNDAYLVLAFQKITSQHPLESLMDVHGS